MPTSKCLARTITTSQAATARSLAALLLVAGCHEGPDPALVRVPNAQTAVANRTVELGRRVKESERWILSQGQAVTDLEGTDFGEREIREYWARKGWRLTRREEHYAAEIEALVQAGHVTPMSRWAKVPFTPVYQALQPVTVLGVSVQPLQEFHFESCENEDVVQLGTPRFKRASGYEEEHEDGHATEPSKAARGP